MDVDGTQLQPTMVVIDGNIVDTLAIEKVTKCIVGIADLEQVMCLIF